MDAYDAPPTTCRLPTPHRDTNHILRVLVWEYGRGSDGSDLEGLKIMEIRTFRKKPVEIKTVQLTFENQEEVKEWCGGKTWSMAPTRMVSGLTIHTLEGDHNANFGDWIIQGVKGEFYPVKDDIFRLTYEEVAA